MCAMEESRKAGKQESRKAEYRVRVDCEALISFVFAIATSTLG
jgi:hypothetical protein